MGGHSDAECYRQVGKKESPAGKKGPMETPARKKASRPPLAPSTGVSSAVRDGDLSSGELVFIAAWLVSYRRTGSVALAAGAALDHWAESSVLHSRAPRVEDESTQDGGAAEEEKKKEEEEEDEWEDIDE
ncbi:uncharacterized protein N7506_005086 [Penicillium brevicompactum]|uniref:uncharacterized protein n=1 Tax=Penicillium brevicompactum TaxID=5074 RepID=UPI002541F9D9|nr:uncharacterized protein N7506_005086 [Penicillium brevicompactum]KAJ5337064.1 hypothetical protein N7506_005086 [Penicillium brevicompactum]